jgi:pre-mRNA-splicing factor SYF1
MLRIKRSVQAQYNTDIGLVAASAQTGGANIPIHGAVTDGVDAMAALEQTAPLSGFVESSTGPVGGAVNDKDISQAEAAAEAEMENPDAIELDDEMQD